MKPKLTFQQIVARPAIEAAPLLLGWEIVRPTPEGTVRLKIVETEAYHQDDPASHSFAGLTKRTAPMFEKGGLLYVYFTYGMHYCLNIVVGQAGVGEAVLLRAGEPIEGIELIKRRRGDNSLKNLANGPAKLAQALAIKDTALSGKKVGEGIFMEPPTRQVLKNNISVSPRVGITKAIDQPWRFFITDSPYISRII